MTIDKTLFHPDYKPEPFWWEAARPGTTYSTNLPTQTEIFIVGSGYAGLSAALELAREGRSVTVVDAWHLAKARAPETAVASVRALI